MIRTTGISHVAVRTADPDGTRGEVNCLDPTFDPEHLDGANIAAPGWYERTRRIKSGRSAR